MNRIARVPRLLAMIGVAVSLAATTASAQQPKTAAMTAAAPPLARYVPKDNLAGLLEFSGLEGHQAAWKATAMSKILSETSMGALLEDILGQLAEKGLANAPLPEKPTGKQALAMLERLFTKGFAFGVFGTRPIPCGRSWSCAAAAAPRVARSSRRLFTILDGGPEQAKGTRKIKAFGGGDPSAVWWDEKGDFVLTTSDRLDEILAVLDGEEAKRRPAPDPRRAAQGRERVPARHARLRRHLQAPPVPPPAVAMGLHSNTYLRSRRT